ncbi:uncharacterized protein LOC117639642 [Thrips palmi]|uniref:Uncharacterized protein LOC117639642 n=1 Tax=Thrips palmi TaxID=161013 RepID=A0A6P8YCC1_THRPL|nr:uncharacterized protein LOC117639642 [Thrips palmi]
MAHSGPSARGPYIAYGVQPICCPSENEQFSLRLSHFNPQRPYDPQMISGYLTFKEDFGDGYMTSVAIDKRSNNQWKENFFLMKFSNMGCSAMRNQIPDLYRIFVETTGAPKSKKVPCVIRAGHYIWKNESVNWNFPNVPIVPYGHYRFRLRCAANDTGKVHMCVEVDGHAIPKP